MLIVFKVFIYAAARYDKRKTQIPNKTSLKLF